MNQFPPGPWESYWGHFEFFTKIHGDIRNFVFVADVIDAGD